MRSAAVSLALLAIVSLSACSEGGKFSAQVIDYGISPGGRWEVLLEVTNTGNDGVTPDCTLRAIDADGIPLASDSVTLDPMDSGETQTTRVLTGLRPGENEVARWRASCD